MTELDPLIPTVNFENYQTTTPPSIHNNNNNTMQQHNSDNNLRGLPHTAAIATSGSQRQLFYRDRIPSHSMTSNSQDYTTTNHLQNSPIVTTIDSTDSESEYNNNNNNYIDDGLPPQPQGLPPPRELHENYSHRLHRNQVAQGHQNFVVGGVHGRYRDYGGTLIEVPEEVYAVRKAALTVLDPITYCWVSFILLIRSVHLVHMQTRTSTLPFSLQYPPILNKNIIAHPNNRIFHISSIRCSKVDE